MNKIDQERRALLKSFLYAFRGVRFCVKSERNMRIHLAAAVLVTAFSLVYKLTALEYGALFLAMGAGLIAGMGYLSAFYYRHVRGVCSLQLH